MRLCKISKIPKLAAPEPNKHEIRNTKKEPQITQIAQIKKLITNLTMTNSEHISDFTIKYFAKKHALTNGSVQRNY